MRTGASDTDADTAVHLDMIRRASPERRLALAMSLSRSVLSQGHDALARQHPEAPREMIGVMFVARHYGPDLAERVRQALAARLS